MQFTLIARKRGTKPEVTVATQYGTTTLLKALDYCKRIYQESDGFNSWQAEQCRCENNSDLCEACELFETYKTKPSRNQEIAETILNQFGGRRFIVITGAHNLTAIENGLQFQLHEGTKDNIRKVRVILDPSDTYRLQFFAKTRDRLNPFVLKDEVEDVYCEMLQDIFENHTGLYTTMAPRR